MLREQRSGILVGKVQRQFVAALAVFRAEAVNMRHKELR
jgi:hypothetical protein